MVVLLGEVKTITLKPLQWCNLNEAFAVQPLQSAKNLLQSDIVFSYLQFLSILFLNTFKQCIFSLSF